jgi:hypothetical protein
MASFLFLFILKYLFLSKVSSLGNRSLQSNNCGEGSEWTLGDCWCSLGFYSEDGKAPCYQCPETSITTRIGKR